MRWELVPDFDKYRVSDTGLVQSRHRGNTWKPLKTTFKDKYPKVALYRNKTRYDKQVHDLVLLAFVGPKPPNCEVCHWNGNHQDNRLENLRYGDHVENAVDRVRHGSIFIPSGSKNSQAKLDEVSVVKIRTLLRAGSSHREIAESFGVSRGTVSNINIGLTWTHIIL